MSFGDNTLRVGKAGQACIRDEPNSFGIATEVSPSTMADTYFKDSDIHWIYIKELKEKEKEKDYDVIIFPANGLGQVFLIYLINVLDCLKEYQIN